MFLLLTAVEIFRHYSMLASQAFVDVLIYNHSLMLPKQLSSSIRARRTAVLKKLRSAHKRLKIAKNRVRTKQKIARKFKEGFI